MPEREIYSTDAVAQKLGLPPEGIEFHVTVYDGKYTYVFFKSGGSRMLRHGEPWDRNTVGDGFILAMAQEINAQRDEIAKIEAMNEEIARQQAEIDQLQAQIAELKFEISHIHS